jgi:hypothetical protein
MKTLNAIFIAPALLAIMTCTGLAEVSVKIRSLDVEDNVYTPYYQVDTERDHEPGPSQRWLRLTVEYETDGGWIDELTVKHFALVSEHGSDEPVVLTEQTTYINVAPGKHVAYVYMHPNCVTRYGVEDDQVDSAATIVIDGKKMAYEETSKHAGKKNWPNNPGFHVHPGHLMSENETPFWFINYDYKEMIKHQTHNGFGAQQEQPQPKGNGAKQ